MTEFLHKLFSSDFMGHGYCYLWKPEIVWLHAISDGLIAISYYFIPVALAYLVRKRRDLPFHWVFFMFGLFIFGCGTTHAMEVWTLWKGTYRLAGLVKAITAGASLATAIVLVPIVPKALRLTSPSQLRAANLELEIAERRRVETALRVALLGVQLRTGELAQLNEELQAEIAQRRLVEETLRKQANLLDLAYDAIIVRDMNDVITYWNAGAEEIYGWKREEAAGKIASQLLHSVCSTSLDILKAEVVRESRWGGELAQTRRDGSKIVVASRWALQQDAEGRPVAVLQIDRDITDRKRAEAALRESEERFRRVFEEGPLGLGLVGKDYYFIKVNSALCQMVGYPEAELLQKTFMDITYPDDLQADMALAEQLYRGERPFYKLQKRYVKKSGEIIWINLTRSVIRDKEGELLYGIAMIEEITEVKRAQEEALARQKLESVGVLAGGIAHDFNNLLGGILASTELALTECAEGSAVEEELQRIKTTSIRGAEIVRELMIYGGEESPTLELVDISALVNEMLQLLKVSISKNTILKIELGQDLPPAHANPAQIRQVVMNLVTNASEAIGEQSGEIRVTSGKVKVGPEPFAPGSVDLAAGDYVRLEVSDTGGGMTPEVQTRIFDPFFTTKCAGRGLGLAAVQGIIRGHGGTISIKSAPGQGSRFEILLPCIDRATQETRDNTAAPSGEEPGTVSRTVLVVEDEETLRLAVSKMLRKEGFSVIEAADGTTAANLFWANERRIDVVLLDMTLPGMSGREVLEEVRRIQPGVKVILTTAFSQASALSSIGEQHLWGFVRKPYKLSELTSLLRIACLDKSKMRAMP